MRAKTLLCGVGLGALSFATLALLRQTVQGIGAFGKWIRVPDDPAPFQGGGHPLVSVLVPARDEERAIEQCVRSLLDQKYPRCRLRVLVVDDRSTDQTPAILHSLSREDNRLTVIHGSEPPPGWTGKCWALQQAATRAEPASDYLLCTDADTWHAPSAVAATVAFASAGGIDLLSLGTAQALYSLAEKLVMPTILAVILSSNGTVTDVNDPFNLGAAKANGQFLLFRSQTYWALGGHQAVAGEIVEDFALARRVKRSGRRLLLADGRHLVRTRMYRSLAEIWAGFSKNAYAASHRETGGVLYGLVALPFLAFGPYLTTLLGLRLLRRRRPRSSSWGAVLFWEGVAQLCATTAFGCVAARQVGLPVLYGLAQPAASLVLFGILANSTWRALSGRGQRWKGRLY